MFGGFHLLKEFLGVLFPEFVNSLFFEDGHSYVFSVEGGTQGSQACWSNTLPLSYTFPSFIDRILKDSSSIAKLSSKDYLYSFTGCLL